MKPVNFSYARPGTLSEATSVLADTGVHLTAGNQSLGPMLNLRLVRPTSVLDLAALPELRQVLETQDSIRFGACITHAEIEDGDVPDPTRGWMRSVAAHIAHRAVRTQGTIGGSLCHADPAADWGCVLPALHGVAVVVGPQGERSIPLDQFCRAPFQTALTADEILVAVIVPRPSETARWGYWKYVRQAGEFAKASAAILIDPDANRFRCVVGALARPPLVLDASRDLIEERISAEDALHQALPDETPQTLHHHVIALKRALALAADARIAETKRGAG